MPPARMLLAIALVFAASACRPLIKHRDFVPASNPVTVSHTGEPHLKGVHHVVPRDAVDDRSAVLVYSTGAAVVDRRNSYRSGRHSAEIRMRFRVRNDERKPIVMEPHNALLVIEGKRKPRVLRPAWVSIDGEQTELLSALVVQPESIASWEMAFELPEGANPLRRVRSFLVSWTYRFDGRAYEERSRFVVARRLSNGALVSANHLLTR